MRFRPLLLTAGLSALLSAGCGSGGDELIPRSDADTISALVADAGAASAAGECEPARRAVREAEQQLSGLPRQTDRALKRNLRGWLDDLDARIAEECSAEPEETATPDATEEPTATATPTETPEETATPTATPTVSPEPTATVDPGTGGEGGPEEPPASGGVPPGEG